MAGVDIRFITDDEVEAFTDAVSVGFGSDHPDPAFGGERFRKLGQLDTTIAAFHRGHVVGTFSSLDLDVTMPGPRPLAVAGTTQVTVHPTHRRRGILTEMMRLHLEQAVERGQAMAALWASEDRIYGRFGYGPAAYGLDLSIKAGTIITPPGPDDVILRPLTPEEAAPILPPLHQRIVASRAGMLSRSGAWWSERVLADLEHWREGGSKARWVLAERQGEPVGYLMFRHKARSGDDTEGTAEVWELLATEPGARRALVSFITNVDLFRNVHWWNAPVDEPILLEADHPRALRWSQIDTLWLRPLDPVAFLEGRGYHPSARGTLVLRIDDPFLGRGGTFRLEVADGAASCQPSADEPDLRLDIAVLGRIQLGGIAPSRLAAAGLITGAADPPVGAEVARLADDLLRTEQPPYCSEVF